MGPTFKSIFDQSHTQKCINSSHALFFLFPSPAPQICSFIQISNKTTHLVFIMRLISLTLITLAIAFVTSLPLPITDNLSNGGDLSHAQNPPNFGLASKPSTLELIDSYLLERRQRVKNTSINRQICDILVQLRANQVKIETLAGSQWQGPNDRRLPKYKKLDQDNKVLMEKLLNMEAEEERDNPQEEGSLDKVWQKLKGWVRSYIWQH